MAKKGPAPAGGSKVDWKTLKGARGSASRVPALVKALADGKTQQDREAAYFAPSQGARPTQLRSPMADGGA